MTSKFASVLLLLLIIPFSVLATGQEEPDPGVSFDLQGYIDREIESGKKKIIIPSGRYRVTPRNREHLRLAHLIDVEIIAEGVEMVCTETTRAITIEDCRKLTLKGLIIDYDPLPFTQGKIVNISSDGLIHDIELFAGYPVSGDILGKKYEIFCPDSRTLRFGSYHGCKVTQPTPGKLRVVKPNRYRKKHSEQVGDIIAIDCSNAPGGSIPHAIFAHKSNQVKLEAVKLYASNCFGFFESDCKGIVYRRCIIDRRPARHDIKKRADPRIRSLNADAFHSKHAEVGPSYIQCEARFQGDDFVAINGDYHIIMESKGKELRVLARRSLNITKGDSVELLSYEGIRLPNATVVSVEPDGSISDAEKLFLSKQRLNDNIKNRMLTKAFRITLDRSVTLPMGSLICSTSRIGNGFKIINCKFGFNRSRGLLIQASKGEISGNLLEGCWMDAIKVAPEYWWLSAGNSSDLVIKDNVIKNCKGGAIAVSSHGGQGKVSPAGAHKNITITGNRIENCQTPQILVTSTDGLIIEKNEIHHTEEQVLKLEQTIVLNKCKNAKVGGNKIVHVEQGTEHEKRNHAP